jgi:hypothetical protein
VIGVIGLVGKLVAPLLGQVFGTIDKAVKDKDLAMKLKSEIQMNAMSMDHTEFTDTLKSQTAIVLAEAKGGFLQRNWRPMLMMTFVIIVANNYVIFPYLSMFTEKAVMLDLPGKLWTLMTVGVGGYVGGRTIEKVAGPVGDKIKNIFKKDR